MVLGSSRFPSVTAAKIRSITTFLDSFRLDIDGKAAAYAQLLRELPVGLSEWAVHPGLGNEQAQAIDPGWRVR